MSISIESFPWGLTSTTASGSQQGTATGVPAEGSALFPVTFSIPFGSSVSFILATILATTRIGEDQLTVQVSSPTTTGFNLYVAGGQPGSTCSVYWQASGT